MRLPTRNKRPGAQSVAEKRSLLAPFKGWNTRDPEALLPRGYAPVLTNLFPVGVSVRLRPGAVDFVTGFASAVKTLLPWTGLTGTDKLFAATDAGIFDATTSGTVGAVVSAITQGWCEHTQFGTSGANYLVVVNGINDLRHYNGTVWVTVPSYAISGGGTLNTNTVAGVGVHNRRLWLAPKDSLVPYFLDINAISGTVSPFPIGGYASKGGHLMAIGTLTLDSGIGPEDQIVFVTSEGQVVVYAGTDPADATKWSLRGVYDLPAPLGRRCLLKFGGDLLILTRGGLFSLVNVLQGRGADPSLAISDVIRPTFAATTLLYGGNQGWQVETLLSEEVLLVNIPTVEGSRGQQFAMNTTTRGWCLLTGWEALCLGQVGNRLYMGMTNKVARIWAGASDFGGEIYGTGKTHFDYFGTAGQTKHWRMVLPVIKASASLSVSVGLDVDFANTTSFTASTSFPSGGDIWGTGLWGTAVWGGGLNPRLGWQSVEAWPGDAAAVRLRISSANGTVEWSSTNVLFERAGIFG